MDTAAGAGEEEEEEEEEVVVEEVVGIEMVAERDGMVEAVEEVQEAAALTSTRTEEELHGTVLLHI